MKKTIIIWMLTSLPISMCTHWDLAALEEKQPIFKVTFVNPEFEDQHGVTKLDLFVQYVRGQDIDRKMVEFRIVATSSTNDDFLLFHQYDSVPYAAKELILLPGGASLLSQRQLHLVHLTMLELNGQPSLYFPFFDTQLNDVSLPFHRPQQLFYRRGVICERAEGSLVTFKEAVFGSRAAPDVREMDADEFFKTGLAIRSEEELMGQLRLAKGEPARIPLQIDAFYFYASQEQEEEREIRKMRYYHLPIDFSLELKAGSTLQRFMSVLRSYILNTMMDKYPSQWHQDEFRADQREDIFLSITPGTESETVRELQRQSIGLDLKGDENISTWTRGNAAFYFRDDERKEFAHVTFSVRKDHHMRHRERSPIANVVSPDLLGNLREMERADVVKVGSEAKKQATLDELVALPPEPSISSDPTVSMKDVKVIETPATVSQRQPTSVWRRLVRSCLNPKCLCGQSGQDPDSSAVAKEGAESQGGLVPQWNLASLEKKQPIFKVTFESLEFEDQYGVGKLNVFVQYVRGQDIHDTQNEEFVDQWSGSSNADRKMIEFRILAASTEKNDFFMFDPEEVIVKVEKLLATGTSLFSPRQMDMMRLKLLTRNFLGFRPTLYFPIFDTQLNDVTLPFHQPLPLFYRNKGFRMLAKESLVTFEEAVFGSDEAPDVRKMEEQDFYDAGWAIRSKAELETKLRLAQRRLAHIVVQIDAVYYYPSRKQKDDDHPIEMFNIGLQAGPGMKDWKLPIKFELKLIPGTTFKRFMKILRFHILNNMVDKLPAYWRRDKFRADKLGDLFLSVTPGTDSETVRELRRETIAFELRRDEKISSWTCGNAAFYFRPDKRKEFVHIVFSVKDKYSLAAEEEAVSENPNTVEGLLRELGIPVHLAAGLKAKGLDYDSLPTAELGHFSNVLLPRQARMIINHFKKMRQ